MTPAQRRAIAALLENRDVKSAAKAANIGEATLFRWLREDDAFVAELRRAENELLDAVTRRLLQAQQGAVAVVIHLLADGSVPPSVRLRAAALLMDQMVKLRELRNFEERLSAMEKALEGRRA